MHGKDEYKRIATIYELLLSRALKSTRRDISRFLDQKKAINILDLCCGTGGQLQILTKGKRHLTGVDFSPAMLAQAKKYHSDSIEYIEADASNLPQLDQATYDAIIISFALHEKSAELHEAIFREAVRLVKPDGYIIIADYSMPPSNLSSWVMGTVLIPIVERSAGLNHYTNYRNWMRNGAIEGFLRKNHSGHSSLITPHFKGCINLIAVSPSQPQTHRQTNKF